MVAGQRAYLVQCAEKGLMWLRLIARGRSGHGSALNEDNAVMHLVEALARLKAHSWPLHLTPAVRGLLSGVAELTGLAMVEEDPASLDALIAALGPAARFVAPTLRTCLNPTALIAGGKVNTIPGAAEARLDIRHMPGTEAEVRAVVERLAGPNVTVETINEDIGVEAPYATPLVEKMTAALTRADPGGIVLPFMVCAGTDAKSLSRLGIASYGFTPLLLPADIDFTAMFHGTDERVPITSLGFGARVLADFLAAC